MCQYSIKNFYKKHLKGYKRAEKYVMPNGITGPEYGCIPINLSLIFYHTFLDFSLSEPIYNLIYSLPSSISSVGSSLLFNLWPQCIKDFLLFGLVMCILNYWWYWTYHEFIHSSVTFLWNAFMDFSAIIFMGNYFSFLLIISVIYLFWEHLLDV